MDLWTCPAGCGRSFSADSVALPVRCSCGHRDIDGAGVRNGQGVRPSQRLPRMEPHSRWLAAGRPERSEAEAAAIFERYCLGCSSFDGRLCTQRDCRSCETVEAIDTSLGEFRISQALHNRLTRATYGCPAEKWRGEDPLSRDVLIFLTAGNPLWDLSDHIRRLGMTCETINAADNRLATIASAIDLYRPRLVVNRSFCVGWDVTERLSQEYPATNWLTVNHSSQAHLLTHAHWLRAQSEFLRLAMDRPNCYLGTPDERVQLRESTGCERVIWLPNVVQLPEYTVTRNRPAVPTVTLVGRRDLVKNFPTQILACGIVAKRRPIRLLIITRGSGEDFRQLSEQCGVPCEVMEWEDQPSYLRLIGQRSDVGLQASFSESFNYVAIDHLGLGIPVVGSPAIRYLPRVWQASPDDAAAIAESLHGVLDRPASSVGLLARRTAEAVAARNNAEFARVVTELAGQSVDVQAVQPCHV